MRFLSVLTNGYYVKLFPYDSNWKSQIHHTFCGENSLEGGDCQNCNKPFLIFFSLDLNDDRLEAGFGGADKIHLLYCWTCSLSKGPFIYKLIGSNTINVIEQLKGPVEVDFPYKDYPVYFPMGNVELERIDSNFQQFVSKVNSGEYDEFDVDIRYEKLLRPQHQIGGEPYLNEGSLRELYCPECDLRMPFLASVGDNCLDSRGFSGNQFVQVIYLACCKCRVIGAYQCSD